MSSVNLLEFALWHLNVLITQYCMNSGDSGRWDFAAHTDFHSWMSQAWEKYARNIVCSKLSQIIVNNFSCHLHHWLSTSLKYKYCCWHFTFTYGTPLQYSYLENPMDGGAWWAAVHGVAKSQTRLSDFTFTFRFHTLEKEMATHSIVLAWRIPRTAEPGGLPSMGSHRVGHDWSDLAAAANWKTGKFSYTDHKACKWFNQLTSPKLSDSKVRTPQLQTTSINTGSIDLLRLRRNTFKRCKHIKSNSVIIPGIMISKLYIFHADIYKASFKNNTVKTSIHTKKCKQMFIAPFFIIAENWKQPRCPSTGEKKAHTYIQWTII